MNKENLTKELSKLFDVDEFEDRLVVHNMFFCSSDDSMDLSILVIPADDRIYLTDNCQTYDKLQERGIEIDSEQNSRFLERILEYSLVSFDSESKEFYIEVDDASLLASSIARLLQTIVVAGSFDIFAL